MIQGGVNTSHEAVVALHVRGPERRTRDIEAVVGTGYRCFLTLPAGLVAQLSLGVRIVASTLTLNKAAA